MFTKKAHLIRIFVITGFEITLLILLFFYSRKRIQASHDKRDVLLEELEQLKKVDITLAVVQSKSHN